MTQADPDEPQPVEGQPMLSQRRSYAKPLTFRPQSRPLTLSESDLVSRIKVKAAELEALYGEAMRDRHQALAMTRLEESVMWVTKGITT